MPGPNGYIRGVDDGPPELFDTISEAETAAGFDFPDAGTPEGWEVTKISVIPVYYFRRLYQDQPELSVTRIPSIEGYRAFVWGGVPEPPPGVHDYVSSAYSSKTGVLMSLNINYPIPSRGPVVPTWEAAQKTQQKMLIGDRPATVSTYRSRDVEVFAVAWRINGVRVSATAYSFTPGLTHGITRDEFIAFLAKVH